MAAKKREATLPPHDAAGFRERVLRQKEELNNRLSAGEISHARFVSEVNELLQRAMDEAAGVLKREEFVAMFGVEPGTKAVLLDPSRVEDTNKK